MCANTALSPQVAIAELGLQRIFGAALANLVKEEGLDLKGLMAKYRLRVEASEAQRLFGKE